MCGNRFGFCLGVALIGCLAVPTSASATSTFTDRSLWEVAVNGVFWDVNLEGDPSNPSDLNGLTAGATLTAGEPIHLPPLFVNDLKFFDTDLTGVAGTGWTNHNASGSGDPLVLSGSLAAPTTLLTGTFSHGYRKFGFEFLPDLIPATGGTVEVTLNDGTAFSTPVHSSGVPQFFGWVAPDGTQITSFSVSFPGNSFTIGNFVVPDNGNTVLFLGIGLLAAVVIGTRRRQTLSVK